MSGFQLNPERLAALQAGDWRAYYDRNWPRLLRLMVQLAQEEFHIPFRCRLWQRFMWLAAPSPGRPFTTTRRMSVDTLSASTGLLPSIVT